MEGIKQWIEAEGSGHWFFIAFPVILLALFIWFKGRRVRFLIPSLIISIVIINPVFYKYWDKLGLYAYWRMLWIVPVIPVLASLFPSLSERSQNSWIKLIMTAVGIALVFWGGTFIYNGTGGTFVEAENASKLPDYVVQIADRLLELDEHPRVVAQDPIGVYIRQYTGEIDTLYGRDISNTYINRPSGEARSVFTILEKTEPDMSEVASIMLEGDYQYLICCKNPGDCFQNVDCIGEYGIYRVIGKPNKLVTRNELGQVEAITLVDIDGNPVNGSEGYSRVSYTYDDNGFIIREFYTDIYGKGVEDKNGCAGFEREYDVKGHIIRDVKLDANNQPTVGALGYSEVRRKYYHNIISSESYFDLRGNPVNQVAGYSYFETKFNSDGEPVQRDYYDREGNLANRIEGYSTVVWEDDGKVKKAQYYNLDNDLIKCEGINIIQNIVYNPDGWSDWMTPIPGYENSYFDIGFTNLGDKTSGDAYSCQLEIEFKGVQAIDGEPLYFWTQGSQDGRWYTGNVWNGELIDLYSPPNDGIYMFNSTVVVSEEMMLVSRFGIGFRCDNWASGSFRIRNVQIVKGGNPIEWTPGV